MGQASPQPGEALEPHSVTDLGSGEAVLHPRRHSLLSVLVKLASRCIPRAPLSLLHALRFGRNYLCLNPRVSLFRAAAREGFPRGPNVCPWGPGEQTSNKCLLSEYANRPFRSAQTIPSVTCFRERQGFVNESLAEKVVWVFESPWILAVREQGRFTGARAASGLLVRSKKQMHVGFGVPKIY